MSVLVDSSAWIDYFRNARDADALELLIEQDLVVVNDLILAEIIPALQIRKENRLISLLRIVKRQPMVIEWDRIIEMQVICLKNGIHGVGLSDLIIAQNAIQCGNRLLSNDKHFPLMAKFLPLDLYP
jgi:predicted nucleic acid-binding protein